MAFCFSIISFFYNLFIHKSKVYFANIRKNIKVYLIV